MAAAGEEALLTRDDTIVAQATPSGQSGLAVVRLSGSAAYEIAAQVLEKTLDIPRRATRTRVQTPQGSLIDEIIAIRYTAPHSYTGENAVELICHGGVVTPARIVAALVKAGARPALAGEFTRRALLNGKLDLLQAEAINDLITAESSAGATLALGQLEGGLSQRILALRAQVLEVEALTAYEVDFPEEDDGPVGEEQIAMAVERLAADLHALIATSPVGELVRTGALVVIAGQANVGKSSLFNALIGRSRAIVTEIPGTTRDALEAVLDVTPYPLRIVDTAGFRDSTDPVEQIGVERSREYLTRADVVLACGDSLSAVATVYELTRATTNAPVLRVRTKMDLIETGESPDELTPSEISTSATKGTGLTTLIAAIEATLQGAQAAPAGDAPIIAHARYRAALENALDEIVTFQHARQSGKLPAIFAATHLHAAARILEELIGPMNADDILARVFSRFCIGK